MNNEIKNFLTEFNNGKIIDQFEKAKEKVQENITDVFTSPTETRKIILTIQFSPDEDRTEVMIESSIKVVLCNPQKTIKKYWLGRNEYGYNSLFSSDTKQTDLFYGAENE